MDNIIEMINAIGATAELTYTFYKGVRSAGASVAEAEKLTLLFMISLKATPPKMENDENND